MTYRQQLLQLGLKESDLKRIRNIKEYYDVSFDKIYEAERISPTYVHMQAPSYESVYKRLKQRGISGKEAKQYVKEYTQGLAENIETIQAEGVTAFDYDVYKDVADVEGVSVNDFLNLSKKDQITALQDMYFELFGKYYPDSDPVQIVKAINEALTEGIRNDND